MLHWLVVEFQTVCAVYTGSTLVLVEPQTSVKLLKLKLELNKVIILSLIHI